MESTIAPEAAPSPNLDLGGNDDGAFFSELQQHHKDAVAGKKPWENNESQPEKNVESKPEPKKVEPKEKMRAKQAEKSVEQTSDDDDLPKYKDREPTEKERLTWKTLKDSKAEYDKLKPSFEKLQKEYNELLKKPSMSKEVEEEIAELRRFRDMTDFKLSDKYYDEVSVPMSKIDNEMTEILDSFQVDKKAFAAALMETTGWRRNVALDKALESAEDEVPAGAAQRLRELSGEMHEIWQKEENMRQDALRGKAAYDQQKRVEMDKKSLAEKQAWREAKSTAIDLVKESAAPLLKGMSEADKKEFLDAMHSTDISDDPKEKALQAVSVQYAALLINQLNKMQDELHKARKEAKALSQSRPNTRQKTGDEPKKLSDDDDDSALLGEIRDMRTTGRWR